ncbi:MAG: insulinase family protein [Sedimentisphaerales bacterium]|nr:insulinase family protein [Sedimentisphaerales bacterium]
MTLVAERLSDVSSGAFVLMLPAGSAHDPDGRNGTGAVLSELVFRGAGQMDNRQLNERLDGLGLQRHSSVSNLHLCHSGALVGENLLETIGIYADVLRRPELKAEQFELCRLLALQSLESLEDDPRHKIGILVVERFLPWPYGRPAPGKRDELQGLTIEEVKSYWASRFSPQGAILAVAGKVDFDQLQETVERNFDDWKGQTPQELTREPCRNEFYHQHNEGAQIHIGVMFPSVHVTDKDYYKALASVAVLSGGMGSRLFTEVREKRGLCYAVGANHRVIGPYGTVQCYLGSSPESAQEGLDVMMSELDRLAEGITQDELDRATVGLRASLIMQGESTAARALAGAGDYYHLKRVRTLAEIENEINALTVNDVIDYLGRHKPGNFTVATIGPKELKVNI